MGDVKDKTCIILDDMSDTCGTLCKAAEVLTQNGAKRVIGIVTHGVLSGKGVNEISRFKLGLCVQYTVYTWNWDACQQRLKIINVNAFSEYCVPRTFLTPLHQVPRWSECLPRRAWSCWW